MRSSDRGRVQVCYQKHVRQLHMEGHVVHAAHLLGTYDPEATITMRKVSHHPSAGPVHRNSSAACRGEVIWPLTTH